ncbi:MAG: phosphotransferase family protein [Gammaproteobacteria bacterium]|nr:phosphotransferase family protein [Gammaproteobacteria bacterium]MCY4274482.1 phosphotransferase family protein [Gammaproteobacteria bacterium]
MTNIIDQIRHLDLWDETVEPKPVSGGITNANFVVESGGRRYFVRTGEDIPVHGILRFNELAANQAAHAAGISPMIIYHQPGIMVLEHIEGKTFREEDICETGNLERILPLLRTCHQEIPRYLRGPILMFWVFHVVRDYASTLEADGSRMKQKLPELLDKAKKLEEWVGPVDIVFGHNDLLAANFLDDGKRIWLIDFDYAGFNSPLFDLGGLASNNGLNENQEHWLLESYFEKPVNERLWMAYSAMKCASLLRESMWSMVSEIHSTLDVDYRSYTEENLDRFESAMQEFEALQT